MNHLKLFEYFGNDVLYYELKDDKELDNFLINHNEETIYQKTIDKINNFIKKHDLDIGEAFITKIADAYSKETDFDPDGNFIRKTSNEVIILENDYDPSISYMIGTYSDNWFLVGVTRQDDEYNQSEWNFKCDTIKGLLQLIMQWDSFISDGSHWDDDQDYEEEEDDEWEWAR